MDDSRKIQLGDLNFIESLREQTRVCGGSIVERDGLVLMRGRNPHPLHNNVVRVDPDADPTRCMSIAREFYRENDSGYIFALLNGQPATELAAAAQSARLVPLQSPPAMFVERRLEDVSAAPDFEIREVVDAAGLADYAEVSQLAWATYGIPANAVGEIFDDPAFLSRPHVRAVVGYYKGAAASAAFVLLSHGIAGIYWVGTVPTARGRGMGEACTRAVTNIAFDAGAVLVTLQASPMGEPIYCRMGYHSLGVYRLCVHPGSTYG
jgi:ribosomal protein S18 acetylase RimI-like enzyme